VVVATDSPEDSRMIGCGGASDGVANRWAKESSSRSTRDEPARKESEPSDSKKPFVEIEMIGSESRTGWGLTSSPGFSLSVPRMNSEFLGLMQYSFTLILLLVTIPWRARKLRTLSGAASLEVENESENSCSKSRCRWRSAPRGSTSTRPVLSSTKKGTCMHSPATLTQFLFLPLCFHSQTSVR